MDTERRDKIVLAACVGVFVLINVILFITGRFPVRQGGLPDWTLTVGVIVGAFITLAVFSFLYKDNPVFRAVENLFVGLGLGVTVYVTWYDYLKPDIYDRLIAPFFSPTARVQRGDYILLIPILLGIMMLTRISRRYGWISRYPICFLVGYGAGFSIQPTIHSMIHSSRWRRPWCLLRCTGGRGWSSGGRRSLPLPPLIMPPRAGGWRLCSRLSVGCSWRPT